ncbi:right-handed parallel beta-helix repeat-containing protein, partial [Clostridium grantii]
HEWGCGIVFKGGKDLEMDNITVTNVTGYGIYTESGTNSNRFDAVYTKNVVSGSISESGIMIESNKNSRTKEVYNISKCGEQFELGYTLGYQGYPYLKNKEYTSYFYDENMNFVEKKDCIQFKKVDIPKEAKYVHFVFPQDKVESNLGYCAWISNFKPPRNVILHDCIIKENRSLGLAFCGGQQWTIENNIFEGNGGNAPSFAVNFEDGWELMQDVIFKNNKFIDNDRDLVVCAGDNLKFEENKFTERVLIWPRATNYKFDGNNFNGGSVSYGSNDGKCIINGNYYNSTSIGTSSVANKVINYMLFNETIIDSTIYLAKGTRLINCDIKAKNTKFLIKNASIENSIIEVKSADIDNSKFKNSKITGANWNLRYSHYSEDCEIIDSNFDSQGDDKIYFKNSKFTNSKIRYSTWGPPSEVTFEGCNILNDSDVSFIELSAGRAELLTLINNKINNKSSKPIISIFDTSYTTPNGNIVLENNELIQENYPYIFNGRDINKGIVNFTDKNNSITGAEMLNPKYLNNQYFNINKN